MEKATILEIGKPDNTPCLMLQQELLVFQNFSIYLPVVS